MTLVEYGRYPLAVMGSGSGYVPGTKSESAHVALVELETHTPWSCHALDLREASFNVLHSSLRWSICMPTPGFLWCGRALPQSSMDSNAFERALRRVYNQNE